MGQLIASLVETSVGLLSNAIPLLVVLLLAVSVDSLGDRPGD
jgi:hypothetical protein